MYFKGLDLDISKALSESSIFKAADIAVEQRLEKDADGNQVPKHLIKLHDPVFERTVIDSKYFSEGSDFNFDKINLEGQATGHFEVENNKDSLRIESVGGGTNSITLKEGTIIMKDKDKKQEPLPLPSLNEQLGLSKKEEEPFSMLQEPKEYETAKKESKPKKERTEDDVFVPTGEYDFLNSLNGRVKVRLFNTKTFVMEINNGYVEIQPFLEEVTEYLKSKTSGRPYIALSMLDADEFLDENGTRHYGITAAGDEVFRLLNNPKGKDLEIQPEVLSETMPHIPYKMVIRPRSIKVRLSRMIESILYDSQFKTKETEDKWPYFKTKTNEQVDSWINDAKSPLSPEFSIEIDNVELPKDLSFNNFLLKNSGELKNAGIDLSFDKSYDKTKSRNFNHPITQVENVQLPSFKINIENYLIESSAIKFKLLKSTNSSEGNINLTKHKATDLKVFNLNINLNKK